MGAKWIALGGGRGGGEEGERSDQGRCGVRSGRGVGLGVGRRGGEELPLHLRWLLRADGGLPPR